MKAKTPKTPKTNRIDMKVPDFINELADKIGNKNHKGVIDFLSRSDIQNMDLDDDFCKLVTSGLMSLEGAKNHAAVKAHHKALALNGVDSEIANAISKFGLDASLFESEKDTYGKLRVFMDKLKEMMEKKPEQSDEWKKKYDDLRKDKIELDSKLADTIEKSKSEKAAVEEMYSGQVLNFLKSNHLKSLQYADKERSLDVNMKLAQIMIDETLTQNGARVINRDGQLKLVRTSDETLDFLNESHKAVTYEDFVKKVLADNKILSVSDPSKVNNPQPQPNQFFPINQNVPQPANNASYLKACEEAMANMNQFN